MKNLSVFCSSTKVAALAKPLCITIALASQPFVLPLLAFTSSLSAYAETAREVDFSQAELDQILAPVALYPDVLLSQVLIASTYPLEIVQADRWARSNKDLRGEDAVKFVQNKDWDPSVKALVAYPDLLQRMSENLDWTQKLGDAFLADEGRVMDAVQNLRSRAAATGSLDKAEHVRVVREERHIVIEPREERVVYVPVYDPVVVYGRWWWTDYPPVVWSYPSSYVFVNGFYWGPSYYRGTTIYYSSGCRWSDRRVVVVDPVVYRDNGTRFYTNISITRYSGAQSWRHDPVHRRGVAYYNDRTSDYFHSNRDSYERDRHYRNEQRDNSGDRNAWNNLPNRNEHITRDNNLNDRDNDKKSNRVNRFDDRYLREHPELNSPRNQPNVMTNASDRDAGNRATDKATELQNRFNERANRLESNNESNTPLNNSDSNSKPKSQWISLDNEAGATNNESSRQQNSDWNQHNDWNQQPRNEQEARDRYYRQQQAREVHTSQPIEQNQFPNQSGNIETNTNTTPRHGVQVISNSAHFPDLNNQRNDNRQENNRFIDRSQRETQQIRTESSHENNPRDDQRETRQNNRETKENRFNRERNDR